MRVVLSSLALLVAFALSAALAADYPVTVVDDLGREITLSAAPERIVSMAPSHTEATCALAACDLLVGVDTWSNWPASVSQLPRLGDAFAPDMESLVALQPDLVLVDEYSGMHEPLTELGMTVYAGTPQTLAETFEYFELLGRMLDRETEATNLVGRLQGELDGVAAILEGVEGPTVFLELDPTPYSAGPNSYMGELLTLAGGVNVLDESLGDFPQVDPEYVVAADPDVILLTDAPFGVTAADVAARPGSTSSARPSTPAPPSTPSCATSCEPSSTARSSAAGCARRSRSPTRRRRRGPGRPWWSWPAYFIRLSSDP